MTAKYLNEEFNLPYISQIPMGIIDTGKMVKEIQEIVNSRLNEKVNYLPYIPWMIL